MVHPRALLPHGHGEILARPELGAWPDVMLSNHNNLTTSDVLVGGLAFAQLRAAARREALAEALAFSRRMAVGVAEPPVKAQLLALTGHQPELFHPGVWVKHFLLDRLCAQTGAVGIDLVVDTDTFEGVTLNAPCLFPRVDRCSQTLVPGGPSATFVGTAVPDSNVVDAFCAGGRAMIESLPAPAIARHFDEYCSCLRSSALETKNLGEWLTFARRRYESPAGTTYLELPVSKMATTGSYLRFAAHLMLDAAAFARAHNAELAGYRERMKVRSSAQPFPDLGSRDGAIEAPFWLITGAGREPVWVEREDDEINVYAGFERVARVAADLESLVAALRIGPLLAPRALTLTAYARVVLGDLFIHGVGGARYDAVTDGTIRRYFGLEPPPFVVASMTMYLPLGAHVVTEQEVSEARHRLHRLEHNPDTMLDQVDFDHAEERSAALQLAQEKAVAVAKIKEPGADKKALGRRIREINAALGEILEPLAVALREEVTLLEGQYAASEVLTDRTYPFCLWSPIEVQDKVR